MFRKLELHQKIGLLSFFWMGSASAISFLEAWINFLAPNLSGELGGQVNSFVFKSLSVADLVLAIILSSCYFFWEGRKVVIWQFIGVILCVIIQQFWLMPNLRLHAVLLKNGHMVDQSIQHITYVVVEIIKFSCLYVLGIRATGSLIVEDEYDRKEIA